MHHGAVNSTAENSTTGIDSTRESFRSYLASLNSAQKSGTGVPAYTRWVNRRLARAIAAGAASLGWGPNAVTFISAGLSAAGLAVLIAAGPSWWSALGTAVLLAAGYVFDSADGQVARLTGTSSPAGEWLDHVVDAIRTPAIHLSVSATVLLHLPQDYWWLAVVAACFSLLSTGQFMSQILAEQLVRNSGEPDAVTGGPAKSFVMLPTDTGILCWSFITWLWPPLFAVVYSLLFLSNLIHSAASMLRKYRKLHMSSQ